MRCRVYGRRPATHHMDANEVNEGLAPLLMVLIVGLPVLCWPARSHMHEGAYGPRPLLGPPQLPYAIEASTSSNWFIKLSRPTR
jgi:hypothetical protein